MFAETLGWKKMFAVIVVASGHGRRHRRCHHHRCQHQVAVAILVVIIIAINAGSFLAVLLICWVVLFTFFGRLACDGPRRNLCLWRDCVGGSLECLEGRVVSTRSDGEGVRRH